jgi:hypothetical protein
MYNRWQRVRAILAIVSMVPLLSCSGKGSAPPVDLEIDVEDRSGQIDPLEAEVADLRNQPISFSPSTPVGTLPGSSSVDPGGQAMYSIPIEVRFPDPGDSQTRVDHWAGRDWRSGRRVWRSIGSSEVFFAGSGAVREGEIQGEPARAARGSMSGGLRWGPRTERVRRGQVGPGRR